jgi:hypothetical protein
MSSDTANAEARGSKEQVPAHMSSRRSREQRGETREYRPPDRPRGTTNYDATNQPDAH